MSEVAVTEPGQQLERVTDHALDRAARLGMWLAAAESKSNDPKARGMAAALRIAYAESLGLPAHAASEVHLINGQLALSAQLKRAQAYAMGFHVIPVKETADSCTVRVMDLKSGKQVGADVTFTLADVKRMGLDKKSNWTMHPEAMLFARASSKAISRYIPHVTLGVLTLEEVEDVEPIKVADAEVVTDDDVPFEAAE